jgi:hypothetical protein
MIVAGHYFDGQTFLISRAISGRVLNSTYNGSLFQFEIALPSWNQITSK